MRNVSKQLIVVLALVAASALWASPANAAQASTTPPAGDRPTPISAPEAELDALGVTSRNHATAGGSGVASAPSSPSSGERGKISSAEAELAAVDDTVARSTKLGEEANALAGTWDRVGTRVVSAPLAELDALLRWQQPDAHPPAVNDSVGHDRAIVQLERSRGTSGCMCMR